MLPSGLIRSRSAFWSDQVKVILRAAFWSYQVKVSLRAAFWSYQIKVSLRAAVRRLTVQNSSPCAIHYYVICLFWYLFFTTLYLIVYFFLRVSTYFCGYLDIIMHMYSFVVNGLIRSNNIIIKFKKSCIEKKRGGGGGEVGSLHRGLENTLVNDECVCNLFNKYSPRNWGWIINV